MIQMFSFIFGFWFGLQSSFPSRISPDIHLFSSDWTLSLGDLYVGIIGEQCYTSLNWKYFYDADVFFIKSGFDSDSRAHFCPESVQIFFYKFQIGHFVPRRRVFGYHWEVVLKFTKLHIALWCRCFLSFSGSDLDSRAHFCPESVQKFIYFI